MTKRLLENYTFNPTAKTITFNRPDFDQIDLARLYLITDITVGIILYQFNSDNGTASGNILTLTTSTAGCLSTDILQIIYDYPQPDSSLTILPDTNILCDDIFDRGPCGWQELYQTASGWNTGRYMPLTLSPHGNFGRYALRMTTANVGSGNYGGAACVIKRLTHQAQPGVVNKGIVKEEFWWTFGSDGSNATNSTSVSAATYSGSAPYAVTVTVASLTGMAVGAAINVSGLGGLTNCGGGAIISAISGSQVTYTINATPSGTYTSGGTVETIFDNCAPRSIAFQLDTERDTNTTTSSAGAGARAFFAATWQQSAQVGGLQNYTGQWYLTQGSGVAYGASGYVTPTSNAAFATGYYTNFPSNQNKRTQQYLALIMDTTNGLWLGMQANDLYFDLTSIPSNGNAPLNSCLAPGDPNYNANDFIGGVNPYVQVNNLTAGGVGTSWGTASWMDLHRVRVSYL